jgi:hypothetical protein
LEDATDTCDSPSVAVQGTSLNGARPNAVWSRHSLGAVLSRRKETCARSHPILNENVLISYAVHRES